MNSYLFLHLLALISGFILDFIFGDPYFIPHPVRFTGFLIKTLEKPLYRQNSRFRGFVLVTAVVLIMCLLSFSVLFALYRLYPPAGCAAEAVMTYQLIAAKCLKVESLKVYSELEKGSLEGARRALSMIVGRDTENLTQEEVIKAAVETVAENTGDGIISPLFYLALGGPAAGFLFKTINTFDSMIGYKNERYINFGFFAARCDDVLNFIPSRLSALFMIAASFILSVNPFSDDRKAYSPVSSFKIWKRDRFNHESPNSAQTESVTAGALGLKLAGPHFYEGKLEEKPYIGDERRKAVNKDIKRADSLMYATTILFETAIIILCTALLTAEIFITTI